MTIHAVTREQILESVTAAFQPQEHILALWQGGSAAFGRADQWSDVDLHVVVQDERVFETFELAEQVLSALSPIDLKFVVPQPTWHGHHQTFYRLKDAGKFLLVDLAVMKYSNPNRFLEIEQHGQAVVHFDKADIVQAPTFDWQAHNRRLQARMPILRTMFDIFQTLTLKEIERNNPIDALVFYQSHTLRPLVEVLRMQYQPERFDFGPRYLAYDLPAEVVSRLEKLYYPTDVQALRAAQAEAQAWFFQIADQLNISASTG